MEEFVRLIGNEKVCAYVTDKLGFKVVTHAKIRAFSENVLKDIGNPQRASSEIPSAVCLGYECRRCVEKCRPVREFQELIGTDDARQIGGNHRKS